MLIALNYFAVLIFGVVIMVLFLDIKLNGNNIIFVSVYLALSGLLQLHLYSAYDLEFIEKSYPLVIHLPLLVFFCGFFKKRFDSVLFVLFTAYIFTVPRRWIGDVVATFFNNNQSI